MTIRIFYTQTDGVYIAEVHSEEWSLDEVRLMEQHGEPEISMSGTIVLFPEILGSQTNSSKSSTLADATKDWVASSLVGRSIVNTTTSATGTVTANTSNTLQATGGSGAMSWEPGNNYSISEVDSTTMPLEEVERRRGHDRPDDPEDEPQDLQRIKSDSPFVRSFDVRDYPLTNSFETAANMANGWALAIRDRIADARAALLAEEDGFSREEVYTYGG